ncbi:hypothetical protein ICQ89_004431 [Salmonella enterica]|nr:hypothetical protein [Salmonella enterica]EBT3245692.1 hypothetical protein [Salmonella enterica subsp. enterica]EDD9347154.1 hypothetical protein [Salmonella enterica subsp. enterica serovar Enteritidis]EED1369103.1 hypothetical protein [Escherichia coli]EEN1169310.1 hypothetical protein [Salmonella enterica subsp. enterica serovar Infantis]
MNMTINPMERYLDLFIAYLHEPLGIACVSIVVILIVWMCYRNPDLWDWVLCVAAIVLVSYAILYSSGETELKKEEWKKWANEHCQIIAKKDGSTTLETGVGVATNGQAATGVFTNSTSDQTAYKCDDGITYWKND